VHAAGEVVVPHSRRRVIGERAGVLSLALPVKMPNARMLMRWIAWSLFAGYFAAIFVKFNFSLPPRQAGERCRDGARANRDRPWNIRERSDSSLIIELIATWREFGIEIDARSMMPRN